MHPKRKCARLACFFMAVLMVLTAVSALADDIPSAKAQSQTVRVKLTRLSLTDRLDVTLNCACLLTTENGFKALLQPDSKLSFIKRENSLYWYYEGLTAQAGKSLRLERTEAEDGELTGFYRTNFPTLYLGDLSLDLENGQLRAILSIHVEDYLLGVVPYEMSDTFPVEALKAQAVAARTYALRKQGSDGDHDLVDTTNDQVFYGYLPGFANAEKAIKETRGVCGFYKGALAQCWYAASNGGKMEAVADVWDTKDDFSYYNTGDDPYDVANPFSVVRSFALSKEYKENVPAALTSLAEKQILAELEKRGYAAEADTYRIDGFMGAVCEMDSKQKAMLRLSLAVSGRRDLSIPDEDTEDVSLFAVDETSEPDPTPAPSEGPKYGPFVALSRPIEVTVPIFPDAEAAFGMDITAHLDNEIWTVAESDTAFTLEARRFGHGVGMSQRGAQWMAATEGKTYREILAFYYPGMKLMRYPEEEAQTVKPEAALSQTAGPAPSPTPRPTPAPLTLRPQKGEKLAEVTGIADDSSLNLRKEPGLNADVLMRLYKGQRLIVVRTCEEAGWVEVRMDNADGFVKEEFLTYVK